VCERENVKKKNLSKSSVIEINVKKFFLQEAERFLNCKVGFVSCILGFLMRLITVSTWGPLLNTSRWTFGS
jgi:hypothetical protein